MTWWDSHHLNKDSSLSLNRNDSSTLIEDYWIKFENEIGIPMQTQSYRIYVNNTSLYQGLNRFFVYRPGRIPGDEALLINVPIRTMRNRGEDRYI